MLGWNLHLDVAHFDAGSRGSRRDKHRCGDQGADAKGDSCEEAEYILYANQTRMHPGKRALNGRIVVVVGGVVKVQYWCTLTYKR